MSQQTGSTGGSDGVTRMSSGARCQRWCVCPCVQESVLLTSSNVSPCETFICKTAASATMHKTGGRHKRDTAQFPTSLFFCGSTTGGGLSVCVRPPLRPCIYSDLYAKSCLHPIQPGAVMTVRPPPPGRPLHLGRILEARGRECDYQRDNNMCWAKEEEGGDQPLI